MRLSHSSSHDFPIAASVDVVSPILSDRAEVYPLIEPLLHDSSSSRLWVMAQVELGPLRLRPAVDVDISTISDHTAPQTVVTGTPVDGFTPAWLWVRLAWVPTGQTCIVSASWDVAFEAPGPQVIGLTLRPLVANGSRRVATELHTRLRLRLEQP